MFSIACDIFFYFGDSMIDDYILFKNLPTLDLHGEDRVGASVKVISFVNDNYKLRNKLLLIIHGKGLGILKNEVFNTLKHNKHVKAYKLDIFNDGTTIVELY